MKTFTLLVLMLVVESTQATTYYFSSSSGDDNRSSLQAQNSLTPWKSLAKLNSFWNSLNAGDVVLLKRGDVFYGSIKVTKSGSISQPITISAYGVGARPVISGLTTLSNWVSIGSGIWESYNPALGNSVNTVLSNNVAQPMGRYPNSNAPNKGYLTFESHTSNSITDNELSSSPNWAGAEVVIRKAYWIMDRNYISSHSGSTLTFVSPSIYTPALDKSGYFIQNDIKTLDQFGEWYYNPSNRKMYMYFGGSSPSNYTVQASSVETLFTNNNTFNINNIVYDFTLDCCFPFNNNNIALDNLTFQGSNYNAVQLCFSSNISFKFCDFLSSGADAIKCGNTESLKVENCYIANSNNNSISLEWANNNAIIRNNNIENTQIIAGMGKSGDGNGLGIQAAGNGNVIENNEVLNTGYSAIYFSGNAVSVKNNFVNNYCITKDDGSGIYTNREPDESFYTGRKITGNVVINGMGTPEGLPDGIAHAHGIYADGVMAGLEITNNTVANNASYGIFCPNPSGVLIDNNTLFNNRDQFVLNHSIKNYPVTNNVITNNIFFSKKPGQMTAAMNSIGNDIGGFGTFDNNYYARPFDDKTTIFNQYVGPLGNISEAYDLATWKAKYNKDASSKKSPVEFPAFIVNTLIGANKCTNGAFNSDILGVEGWTALNNMSTTYATGVLDGGSLKVSFTPVPGTPGSSLIIMNVGAVSAAKKYILRFSLKGSNDNFSLGAFLREHGGNYYPITNTQYSKIASIRSENELLFTVPEDKASADIVFTVDNQDIQFWLDNIQFYEANVTLTNADDYIRFEYNSTGLVKTVPLDKNYIDVKENLYPGTVTLLPFSSVILMKTTQTGSGDNTPPTIVPKNITINADVNGQATIQPFDVIQSITDNSGVDNSSIAISQSQFACASASNTIHQAYIATTTNGTQNFGGELGMEFKVNNAGGITISQLGAFDHQGNGITGTQSGGVRVAIFNKATKTIVPGLDAIIIGNADAYSGNHRMKNISPVLLMPGDYVVVAKGYNQNELNGNSEGGTPFASGDLASGAINYASACMYGSAAAGFAYPSNPDGGPGNRYLAGSFTYSTTSVPNASAVSHQAYIATTTNGTQNFGGELGMEFRVNNAAGITVDQLGAFDHQGNGITGTQSGGIRVAIFNKATKTIVPGLDAIIIGNADSYSGNHRLKSIPAVVLAPGDYVVVAKGYNQNELNGNSEGGTPFASGDVANGAITYAATSMYGSTASGFSYPSNTDGAPGNRYLAGTFSYSVITTGSSSHQAYVAATTNGTQNFGGELGMEFKVNSSSGITVNQLGAFDHQGNGITGTQSGGIRVAIFNKATKTIVPGLDAIIVGNADAYSGNHRMKNVSPVTLAPGDYVVVAKGYNQSELNGNSEGGTPFAPGDLANGAISYAGTCMYGSAAAGFAYPSNPDGGPGNRYLAGTFAYLTAGTGQTSNANTVTITAKDIYGNVGQTTAIVTLVCSNANSEAQTTTDAQVATTQIEGVQPRESNSLNVYPSPTTGLFSVQLSNLKNSPRSIQILNESGRMIMHKTLSVQVPAGNLKADFNLSNQPSGIYFIKVITSQGVQVSKVLLVR